MQWNGSTTTRNIPTEKGWPWAWFGLPKTPSGWTEPGTARRLETLLQKVPLATRDSISLEDILTGVTMDKKKRGNTLTLVLVPKIGTSLLKKVELGQLANYFRGEA